MELWICICICTVKFCYSELNFLDRCARSPRDFYFREAIVGFPFLKISICSEVSFSG